jgi:phosphate transport system permease protein
MWLAAALANGIALAIGLGLLLRSLPVLSEKPLWHLLFSSSWRPMKGDYGFLPFIISTLEVTALAMVMAVPVCLLASLYLSEYARRRFREAARLVVDIMAAIPSVVYGLCGVIAVVPAVRAIGHGLGIPTTGYTLLSGAVILSVMVAPVIISVSLEVFRAIPAQARETTLSLGATRWEMIRAVILRAGFHGWISAIILGFARAFGETIAVLMVVGNVPRVPWSIFDPAYPLPALIANSYGEMMSIPLYQSALLLSALILLALVAGFTLTAHLTLLRTGEGGLR